VDSDGDQYHRVKDRGDAGDCENLDVTRKG
jgi:hypothetical protein